MISLRTNISSLITQNNMADSTNKLNQALFFPSPRARVRERVLPVGKIGGVYVKY